jgi:hypothetical protein
MIENLALAMLGWVHWHNQVCLHGFIGVVPPAEFEEMAYGENRQAKVLEENTTLVSLQDPRRFKFSLYIILFPDGNLTSDTRRTRSQASNGAQQA